MRKGAYWLIGTSTVLAVTLPLAVNFGPSLASRVVEGGFNFGGAVKWSSIIAGIGLGIFLLVRHGVIAFENLEEGERGYRRRWGKIVTKRKTGKRNLLLPGKRHPYIKYMYDVVVQSVRIRSSPEEPNYDKPVKATLKGLNIWYVLVIDWCVEDVEVSIYKSLTQVYQVRRAQEGNDALENYVLNQVHKTVRRHLDEFDVVEGLPVLTIDEAVGTVPDGLSELLTVLHTTFGVRIHGIDPVLLTTAPEEAIRGLKA